ncbi:c-type cytochrome [Crenobacter cavernae]|uniref:Cytochrome C biogenesis protein CcsA n=1 Tax=Crenobacter cavernae TaxID=2290923 RepID=A0ABY0FFV4_9NEIS|nr:c-type cytochrome [Crenobacter cavernae]RXZ43847.1 cytochrome C biogenesis protein CcsA [Crenobacter cavernae]
MKNPLIAAIVLGTLASPAFANLQMAQKYGCTACHDVGTKKIGPAFKDIAKKYAGDKSAETKLAAKVKKGGSGVWGTMPMPPQAQVNDADLKTLVKWVLATK